jgi:hypothetical protein
MPENRVLFEIGTEPWTLAGVCLVLGLGMFVVAGSLMALLLVRYGRVRRLRGYEASRVAFNADRIGGEIRPIHGPATGVEVRVTFTIGDLRRAHRQGDRLMFWGGPAMLMSWSTAFGLSSFAGAVAMREYGFLAGYVVLVPMFLIAGFMPWAAIHTELE